MKFFKNVIAIVGIAAVMAPSQAYVLTFGGQKADDNSGLTSWKISADNMPTYDSGYLIETFDYVTKSNDPFLKDFGTHKVDGSSNLGSNGPLNLAPLPSGVKIDSSPAGCAINSYGAVGLTATGGGLGVRKGNTDSKAAPPAGDGTCFGFGPQAESENMTATARVDYTGFLTAGTKINYLGLYYGSVDTYNDIAFYSGNTLITLVTGTQILAELFGVSGDQLSDRSNVYVNMEFDSSEAFTSFEFRNTTQRAFEFDNLVIGLTSRGQQLPEPESLALVGLGLMGLAAARRRKST